MTYALDLPADVIASIRDAAKDASISAARTFGFGGSTWDYAEPAAGATATGPKTLTTAGTVQALAFRQRPGALAVTGGGTPILADDWRLIVLDGTVRPGGVIVSQDDDRYAFEVATVEPWYDYKRAELHRLRGTISIGAGGEPTIAAGTWIGIRAIPTYAEDIA